MTRLQGGISGIGQRKRPIRRDWSEARAKVEREAVCRGCGGACGRLEAAHVLGREHDANQPLRPSSRWRPFLVAPDRIIPLGGPATDVTTCHGKQHAKRLDTLPLLTPIEQAQAVVDAGGIFQALTSLLPSESPKRVARAEESVL